MKWEAHFGAFSAEDFARVINRVETGFIRTEADEVHYNLHALRFDLERQLSGGHWMWPTLKRRGNSFAEDFDGG
jgi:carboxypeptidase Taq